MFKNALVSHKWSWFCMVNGSTGKWNRILVMLMEYYNSVQNGRCILARLVYSCCKVPSGVLEVNVYRSDMKVYRSRSTPGVDTEVESISLCRQFDYGLTAWTSFARAFFRVLTCASIVVFTPGRGWIEPTLESQVYQSRCTFPRTLVSRDGIVSVRFTRS